MCFIHMDMFYNETIYIYTLKFSITLRIFKHVWPEHTYRLYYYTVGIAYIAS